MSDKIDIFINDGIPTCILSILVVFAMLTLLIGAIVLLGKIVSYFVNKTKAKESSTRIESETVQKEKASEEVAVTKSEEDSLELIAVITAVIAAQMETTTDKLIVKSLRKVERKTL